MRENGYNFPVLPGSGFISNVLASAIAIPQTWIVDSNGKWQWTERSFGAPNNWEDNTIKKLEAAYMAKK